MVKKTDTRRRREPQPMPTCPAICKIRERRLASMVASKLGLSRSAVSMWRRVPSRHVPTVSALLRIARHRIRSDLYRAK